MKKFKGNKFPLINKMEFVSEKKVNGKRLILLRDPKTLKLHILEGKKTKKIKKQEWQQLM